MSPKQSENTDCPPPPKKQSENTECPPPPKKRFTIELPASISFEIVNDLKMLRSHEEIGCHKSHPNFDRKDTHTTQ